MLNPGAVALLTRMFSTGSLPHPGDENTPSRLIPIPGFRSVGMSDEQAQEMIGSAAKLWSEAIVSVIQGEYELLTKADAAQLRQDAADAPDGTRVLTLYDRTDHQLKSPLLQLTVGKSNDVMVNPALLRKLGA